ncbi:hypothetical protein [Pacificispira sp.]|uniref:hypothetical protein n=1 Tax=Pacificispira sp. TaxID=2888761 RepID=UPI003BAD0599
MKILRYDSGALAKDAARGLIGLAVTAGPALGVENILRPIEIVCWALATLFAVFLLRTALRHKTEIQLSEDAIAVQSPLRRRQLKWSDITVVKLSYFASAKARRGSGVLTLTLRGGGTKIIVESSLKEFDRLAESVAELCARQGIDVDPTTMHNFDAMGSPIRR